MTNWQTKRSDSAGTETLALKRVVFWDSEEPTTTRPLAINVLGDNLYFPTVDLTKNVCELVDFYGDIAATYDYASFGAVTAGTPSGSAVPANPFQFSSEFYDSELGLVYYNYRHYSPADGRWISRDPIEEQGGWNLYAFLRNCLFNRLDLKGAKISLVSGLYESSVVLIPSGSPYLKGNLAYTQLHISKAGGRSNLVKSRIFKTDIYELRASADIDLKVIGIKQSPETGWS